MPKIGWRIIKSSMAVYVCFLLNYLFGCAPFYSAIAAVLCIQQNVKGSFRVAINRIIGTFLGGFAGMLLLFALRLAQVKMESLLHYTAVALAIIPLMYLTVLLKQQTATYISCVVFMSIAVSHGADANPAHFAFMRVCETLLGIFVAVVINAVPPPKSRREKASLPENDFKV